MDEAHLFAPCGEMTHSSLEPLLRAAETLSSREAMAREAISSNPPALAAMPHPFPRLHTRTDHGTDRKVMYGRKGVSPNAVEMNKSNLQSAIDQVGS